MSRPVRKPAAPNNYPVIGLFSASLLLSAFLLFWMQLMVGKLVLPLLGGSPAVWNTCLFFFQGVLLLGYGYAHWLTRWQLKTQIIGHIVLMLLPLPLLPIALQPALPTGENPIGWLLTHLLLAVGLPFFVLSATAPLLQGWLARINIFESHDPYFLYAASNAGSLLGLASYPLLIEPWLPLLQQATVWMVADWCLIGLVAVCGSFLWQPDPHPQEPIPSPPLKAIAPFPPVDSAQKARWVLLSFLPSSLLLGVTAYLTTDLAAMPLLWVVPLMIYLLTFIAAFAGHSILPQIPWRAIAPLLLTALCLLFLLQIVQPLWLLLPLHLLGLGLVAGIFHGELAQQRPAPAQLTQYYLWIAVGGLLGGVLNAIAAPLLFSTVVEYPLALVCSLLVLQALERAERAMRVTLLLAIGLLAGGLLIGVQINTWQWGGVVLGVVVLKAIDFAFQFNGWKVMTGFVLIGLLMQFSLTPSHLLVGDRSFFGVYRVLSSADGASYHSLLHGTTLHGKQSLDPDRRQEPLTYFARSGPVGQLFKALEEHKRYPNPPTQHIGVLGLGVGTLAAYGQTGQQWTFYEIDPLARQLATDPRYFTFLQDSPAAIEIIIGDGRLAIAQAPDRSYDLLFMDAFSSDAIPVHLITQEAIATYFTKLTDRGLLVVNITNRFLQLEPVLGAIAQSLDLVTLTQAAAVSEVERQQGKAPSHWVILARQPAALGRLVEDSRWQAIVTPPNSPLWTDESSNVLRVLRWWVDRRS